MEDILIGNITNVNWTKEKDDKKINKMSKMPNNHALVYVKNNKIYMKNIEGINDKFVLEDKNNLLNEYLSDNIEYYCVKYEVSNNLESELDLQQQKIDKMRNRFIEMEDKLKRIEKDMNNLEESLEFEEDVADSIANILVKSNRLSA